MRDEQQGKQRWREVPPSSNDERWSLENPPHIGERHASPRDCRFDKPPADARRQVSAASAAHRERMFEGTRRAEAPRTIVALALAIGAIGLIIALTMYLASHH
jgi:hypothetical protein